LHNRLKQIREAQGLSLVALAAKVGTSSQQISHLELGKRHLTVEWLNRLATALQCHPWALVSEAPPPFSTERERGLIELFRALPEAEQQALVDSLGAKAKVARPSPTRKRAQVGSS
jgi:transcriptional regulator with XRE-family HTH domain